MTWFYDPIHFVKLVQKILVKYERIMGICGKIFIIYLHNLQMLFMLWIKYKFSECLAPLHKHEGPDGRLSGDSSAQARRHGGHLGAVTPKSFLWSCKFCCAQKNLFQTHDKKKNLLPKNVFPPNLKPGFGPGSAKIVSAIRIFCFEGHSVSRCSITSNIFLYITTRGPLQAF